ncbi:MAG: hypothetical protein ACXWFZ_02030 [Nitrososphaeraceae archaeon]
MKRNFSESSELLDDDQSEVIAVYRSTKTNGYKVLDFVEHAISIRTFKIYQS